MLWFTLPNSADSSKIYEEAVKKNTLIAPGNLFSVKDQYSNCMRLNAGVWNDDIEKAIGYLVISVVSKSDKQKKGGYS